ncbi:MAG: TOBE domain-containing protein, partial [Actinomycetota bacterium]
ALARALAPEPALLLLDEPLSHLERQLRAHLADEMVAIVRSSGAGALWVTHDQEEGLSVADRVAVMEAGRLRQVDAPEHLWRNPADASVAGFIGAGEILSATVRDGRAATVLGPVAAPGHAEGCEVKVLVRPEDVSIGGEGTAAEVIRRGFIGGDTVYYLRLQDGGHVRSRERGGVKYESGAQVRVQLNGSSLTVFSE